MITLFTALLALSSFGNAIGYVLTGSRTNLVAFVITAIIASYLMIFYAGE